MTPAEFNQKCIEKLKQLRFTDRVAVVGSGLSYKLIKNIGQLVTAMEGPCKVKRVANEPYVEFFDRAFIGDPSSYLQAVKEAFENNSAWAANAYLHLVRIGFRSFVTLNIDTQLPDAYAYVMSLNQATVDFKIFPGGQIYMPPELSGPKQRLVALHGCYNPKNLNWHKNLILRNEEYQTHYFLKPKEPAPFLFTWWYWLLTTLPCVFIGTSLEEIGLAGVIRHIQGMGLDVFNTQKHIHLKATDEITPNYSLTEQYSLGCIPQVLYDKVDQDHKGLREVLAEFSGYRDGGTSPAEDESFPLKDSLEFLKQKGAPSK